MKKKQIRLRMPGEQLSPEEIAAYKKKQAASEAEANKPSLLARREVVISVLSLLGVVAVAWLLSWWFSARFYTGTIEGVVTCDGAPLTGGQITFVPDQPGRPSASSPIDASGRYSVKKCPTGPCRITVQTFQPAPVGSDIPKEIKLPGKAQPAVPVGPYVKIPEVYAKPNETPLTYNVTTGTQTHPVGVTNQ